MTDETTQQEPAAEPVQPTIADVAAQRNADNLARAIEGGYHAEEAPSRQDRIDALIASLEHQVKHNGPITLEMLSEVRSLLAA